MIPHVHTPGLQRPVGSARALAFSRTTSDLHDLHVCIVLCCSCVNCCVKMLRARARWTQEHTVPEAEQLQERYAIKCKTNYDKGHWDQLTKALAWAPTGHLNCSCLPH